MTLSPFGIALPQSGSDGVGYDLDRMHGASYHIALASAKGYSDTIVEAR